MRKRIGNPTHYWLSRIGGALIALMLIMLMPLSAYSVNVTKSNTAKPSVVSGRSSAYLVLARQQGGPAEAQQVAALSATVAPSAALKNKFPNVDDYIFGGCDIALVIIFSAVLVPYFLATAYLHKRRKTYAKIQELKGVVAQHYEFK